MEKPGSELGAILIRDAGNSVQYKQKPGASDGQRPAARGASLSGGPSSSKGSKTAACTRSLSGPVRAGASKNLGAFRLKLRLKPPPLVDGLSAADGSLSDLPFSGAGGRRLRSREPRPIACQCVSLALRLGRHSHQLRALSGTLKRKSVAPVTNVSDGDQSGRQRLFVPWVTGSPF